MGFTCSCGFSVELAFPPHCPLPSVSGWTERMDRSDGDTLDSSLARPPSHWWALTRLPTGRCGLRSTPSSTFHHLFPQNQSQGSQEEGKNIWDMGNADLTPLLSPQQPTHPAALLSPQELSSLVGARPPSLSRQPRDPLPCSNEGGWRASLATNGR